MSRDDERVYAVLVLTAWGCGLVFLGTCLYVLWSNLEFVTSFKVLMTCVVVGAFCGTLAAWMNRS